jgi:Kef-type K+ transport system membrane component KefB
MFFFFFLRLFLLSLSLFSYAFLSSRIATTSIDIMAKALFTKRLTKELRGNLILAQSFFHQL